MMYEYRNNPYPDSRLHADCCGHHILPVQAELRQYFMAALWMQPDCRYLERPYEYDYPARNINLLFSVSVMVIGILAMLFILTRICPTTYRQRDGLPPLQFFTLHMPPARCFSGGRTTATVSAMPTGLHHSAMERYIRSSGSCNHICPLPYKCDDITCLSWGEYGLLSALLSVPHI